MDHIRVGSIDIRRVPEISGPLMPILKFFPDLTREMLGEHRAFLPTNNLTDDDQIVLSFHSYLVKTDRYNILIDSCCGNGKTRPTRPSFSNLDTNYLATLAAAGCGPEDIDFVMCTHLHWDHVGWNTQLVDGRWVPTFPNARYIMARREYDYWNKHFANSPSSIHRDAFEDSVQPVVRAERAILVDDDHEIDKGIWLEPCPGHTPGQVIVNLRSGDDCGIMTGDVIHHRIQLRFPELSAIADTDPILARQSRMTLLARHADTDCVLFPAHFPAPSFGSIQSASDGGGYLFSGDQP